ncbi:hypothetical protein Tco_1025445 [Tanacetum coccineum]
MSTPRQSMNSEAIEELIAQRVADALETYKTNRNTKNSNENGNENGSASHSDGGSGSRRIVHTTRGCTYKEFLNCQPLNFKGTEGAPMMQAKSELWNLTLKGTDVVGYTQRFQSLALLCPRMVPEEEDKVERYIWGPPDNQANSEECEA